MELPARSLRVLCFKEGGCWVAIGLEHCIATQAQTLSELLVEFERLLASQIRLDLSTGQVPLGRLPPAPQSYFDRYEQALASARPVTEPPPVPSSLPSVREIIQEMRVAA